MSKPFLLKQEMNNADWVICAQWLPLHLHLVSFIERRTIILISESFSNAAGKCIESSK